MEYPREFSAQARGRVEVEQIRAHRDLDQNRNQVAWSRYGPVAADEGNLRRYILRVFLAFSEEACKLELWAVDRVRSEALEFLRLFTIQAYYEDGHDKSGRKLSRMISDHDGSILSEVEREFRKLAEWGQFEEQLLALEKVGARTGPARSETEVGDSQIASSPLTPRKTNKRTRRMAEARTRITLLWTEAEGATYKEIINRADSVNIDVPWPDCETWASALEKRESSVKTLLSKARRSSQTQK